MIHAVAKYKVSPEPRHLYFFREGSVVLWNVPEIECQSIVEFVQPYEVKSYDKVIVQEEKESMPYTYIHSRFVAVNLYFVHFNSFLCIKYVNWCTVSKFWFL